MNEEGQQRERRQQSQAARQDLGLGTPRDHVAQDQHRQQGQGAHSAEQVTGDDHGLEQARDGKHAQQGLTRDDSQQQHLKPRAAPPALAPGEHRQGQDGQAQQAGGVAVDHLFPGLGGFHGLPEAMLGGMDLMGLVGHADQLAITAGPVGAAQPRIGEAHVSPQGHHHQGQEQGGEGEPSIGSGHGRGLGSGLRPGGRGRGLRTAR